MSFPSNFVVYRSAHPWTSRRYRYEEALEKVHLPANVFSFLSRSAGSMDGQITRSRSGDNVDPNAALRGRRQTGAGFNERTNDLQNETGKKDDNLVK